MRCDFVRVVDLGVPGNMFRLRGSSAVTALQRMKSISW